MQLHLTGDELKLLAEILEQRDAELRAEPALSRDGQPRKPVLARGLLEHVIDRDLGFSSDELDCMAAMLAEQGRKLQREISRAEGPAKHRLLQEQIVLEHLSDKVTEACAMA